MKRFISLILAIIMVVAMVPGMALAAVEPAPIEYNIMTESLTSTALKDYAVDSFSNSHLSKVSWLAKGTVTNAALDLTKTAAYQMSNRLKGAIDNSPQLCSGAFFSQFVVNQWNNLTGYPTGSGEGDEHNKDNYSDGSIQYGIRIKVESAGNYKLSLANNLTLTEMKGNYASAGSFFDNKSNPTTLKYGAVTKVYFAKATDAANNTAESEATSRQNEKKALENEAYESKYLGLYDSRITGEQAYDMTLSIPEAGEYYVIFIADDDCLNDELGGNPNVYVANSGSADKGFYKTEYQLFVLSNITLTPVLPPRELNYVVGSKALTSTALEDYKLSSMFGASNMSYVSWLPKLSSTQNAALDLEKTDGYELYLRQDTSYQSGLDLRENALETALIVGKNSTVGDTAFASYNNFKVPVRINVPRDGTYKLSLINDYPFDSINKSYKEGNKIDGAFTKGAYVKVHLAKALENTPSGSYLPKGKDVEQANAALEVKDYSNNWWYDVTKLGVEQQYDDELELEAGEYFVVFEACEEGTKKNAVSPHATNNNLNQMFYLSNITLTPVEEEPAESEEETAMKEAIAEEVTEEGLDDTSYVNIITASVDSADDAFEETTDRIKATRGKNVTVTADEISGYDFLYWRSGLGKDAKVITNNPECTVKAVPGTWLTAVYKATSSEKVSVLFYNADGDIIENELVGKGTAITFPGIPVAPAGCGEFSGWALNTKENIVVSANATGNSMVFVAQYSDPAKNITVNVPEGATGGGSYAYGDEVTVTATERDNESKVFVYWKKGDEIVSFDKEYTFNAFENCELTAVYAEYKPVTEALRKIIIKGNVAEFIGLDSAVEKGVIFRDTDATAATLGNATHKIAMTTTGNHLSFNNDLTGNGVTNFIGYAILSNGNVIYDK